MQVYLLSEVIPSQGLIFSCYAKLYTLSTISSCSSQPFTQIENKMVHGIFVCMSSKTWNIRQYRGWCIKFATGLNIIIGIVQKVYEWPGCYFAKMILLWGIIWAKGQLDHSYTFWAMPIMIFSPVANYGDQSLYWLFYVIIRDFIRLTTF